MRRGLVVVLGLLATGLGAQVPGYPVITKLSALDDPLFKQQQDLVDLSYQNLAGRDPVGDLVLFQYKTGPDDDLFSLASRFNVPYETLVTLNGLSGPKSVRPGQWILAPTQPGVFVDLNRPAEIDQLMTARLSALTGPGTDLTIQRPSGPVKVKFFIGQRFHPLERAYFLGILFRFPLPKGVLTSGFGVRANPFTGHAVFHAGIDLAAPTGTEVYAARDGVVSATGVDELLGNFVKVDHGDGYQTVYGHLSKVEVSLHQSVSSGTILGRVGSTGQSTGPHLHFEIRRQGAPQDPVPLLPGKR